MSKNKQENKVKKKQKKNISTAIANIFTSSNNTIVSIADESGDVVLASSAGAQGFKGSRKSTPFAAQATAEYVAKKAVEYGIKVVSVFVKGPGNGRESALRAFAAVGLTVILIKDVTPVALNGCRPPKRRRV